MATRRRRRARRTRRHYLTRRQKQKIIATAIPIYLIIILLGVMLARYNREKSNNDVIIYYDETETESESETTTEEATQQTTEAATEATEVTTEATAETTEPATEVEEQQEDAIQEIQGTVVNMHEDDYCDRLQVYCTINDIPCWDIKAYNTEQEAKTHIYTVEDLGVKRFCTSGFDTVEDVRGQLTNSNGEVIQMTDSYFCEGVYSFEADFIAGDYVAELTYTESGVQDSVYFALTFR